MVIKFNPEGRVVMVLGRRPEADGCHGHGGSGKPRGATGGSTCSTVRRMWRGMPREISLFPTATATRAVVKYDKNGTIHRDGWHEGLRAGAIESAAHDCGGREGNVYVGDRSNARIEVFDNDLVFKAIYDQVGAPWAVCITPGPHQYLYSSNSNPDSNSSEMNAVTGEIYKMELDGTILGKFGKAGKQVGKFSTVHEIDCRNPNELLVSEITAWRVQKIVLHPSGK